MTLNPVDLGDIAATVGAVFALGALIVAIVAARIASNAKGEAKRSADAAEDSATSSERSATAAEKSAQSDETMARLAEEQANQYKIPWRFEHYRKQTFLLVHDDHQETAYEVALEGAGVLRIDEPKETLGPQETLSFMYGPTDREGRDVRVIWRRASDPEGEHRVWSGIPKPPY